MSDATSAEKRLHHVAVIVRDIDAALSFYRDGLGLALTRRLTLEQLDVEVALLALENAAFELIEPLSADGSAARFLERRGEALHHLCFTTPDLRAEMAALRDRGVELVDDEPYAGAVGPVCFYQPRAHAGVLVELVEVAPDPREAAHA